MLTISEKLKKTYPGTHIGLLLMRDVSNPKHSSKLDEYKKMLENQLKEQFAGFNRKGLKSLEPIKTYCSFYKRFRKTYHVLLQLESIVFKGKTIPRAASLVEAMFMAELKNLLLTAGHDLKNVRMPIRVDVSVGGEKYTQLNGQEKELIAGDMMMLDDEGIISSVIYGPDRRTRIKPSTGDVLFVVYAPPGIQEFTVCEHLKDIQKYVKLVAPGAETELLQVYGTV